MSAYLRPTRQRRVTIELASRRHGPFDPRYANRLSLATDVAALPGFATGAVGADALDWQAFSTRFFPGRGRHDLEAVKAFAAHRNGSGGGPLTGRALSGEQAAAPAAPGRPASWSARDGAGGSTNGASTNGGLAASEDRERQEALLASTATEAWEGEGGATR